MNEGFELGAPALVCRWRLAGARLPLENRHLRALAARRVAGRGVTSELVAWAQQHLEWNLQTGAAREPDGVLMLVVDEAGHAAMSVGPYGELADCSAAALASRADLACHEAADAVAGTGVAPETLWRVADGRLIWWPGEGCELSGAASLVEQLAATLGFEVVRMPWDQDKVYDDAPSALDADEVFLVSDEHGVVPASDACGPVGERLRDAWQTLLERTRQRA